MINAVMHDVDIKPGTYVVAVSGGVDSTVLLDLLAKLAKSPQPKVPSNKRTFSFQLSAKDSTNRFRFVVAHYDHGIREDSKLDRELVQKLARKYNLPFVYDQGNLGPKASEATAREARYAFLNKVKDSVGAQAIITAHHQDDVLETAIINLLRGTNRKGLSSLQSRTDIVRPLLNIPKREIIKYAKTHKLNWREDSTNQDTKYLRNHIRCNILPKFSGAQKAQLLKHIAELNQTNKKIDNALVAQFLVQPSVNELDRRWFIELPHAVAREVLASWLRQRGLTTVDKKKLEQLVIAAKTLTKGKRSDINSRYYMLVEKDKLVLVERDR